MPPAKKLIKRTISGGKKKAPVVVPSNPKILNREHWLTEVGKLVVPFINNVTGKMLPPFRVTCGWPHKNGLSLKKTRIGECWDGTVSTDGTVEIFISPRVSDSVEVVGVVAHELCHAAVGNKVGHKGPFVVAIRAIGLTGKPTATSPGERFKEEIADPILKKLGPYPYVGMKPNPHAKVAPTRLIKAMCPEDGYIVRVTRKWIDSAGCPICPICNEPMQEEAA